MRTVAYLANRFPEAVEPYVNEEMRELRRRGMRVIPGTVRKPKLHSHGSKVVVDEKEIVSLQPIRILTMVRALVLIMRHWRQIASLLRRVLLQGSEPSKQRLKALLHTALGACYAAELKGRGVDHIHVHHGYFGSWIALTAARLLNITYSLTLHGSDLLLKGAYLETKLEDCRFCATISEYNRRYILTNFPALEPEKVSVCRLGVAVPEHLESTGRSPRRTGCLTLLAVGRLQPVKDHAFLVRACARLRDRGISFACAIAGDGPERHPLELSIRENGLENQFALLGHVPRSRMDSLYRKADVLVLTSRSEGIPLVLMEAMARSTIVLAPAITGIPEIVIPGKTGFLYIPGVVEDFVEKILFLDQLLRAETAAFSPLDWIRHAARVQVLHNFNSTRNLIHFGDQFLARIANPSLP